MPKLLEVLPVRTAVDESQNIHQHDFLGTPAFYFRTIHTVGIPAGIYSVSGHQK